MTTWISRFERYSKPLLMSLSLFLVGVIGFVDWVTGFELSVFVFYLIPVALAVWYVGDLFGIIICLLSIGVWVAADVSAGAKYSSPLVPVWNAIIALSFLLVVAGILRRLRNLHHDLEERVRQRTEALTSEMQERTRLEQELLGISEREQRRIGHDLHDSLCQHLTGTALAGQVLEEKLVEKSLPEAAAAQQVVELVEGAIELTRSLARGLHPMELEDEGFRDAFKELAANVTERFKTRCRFECPVGVRIAAPAGAIHLYRIAQEAINNAIRHSKAREIVIRLDQNETALTLSVSDDGTGLPEKARSGQGMGLRIMAYRASMIGASFKLEPVSPHGVRVMCILPLNIQSSA